MSGGEGGGALGKIHSQFTGMRREHYAIESSGAVSHPTCFSQSGRYKQNSACEKLDDRTGPQAKAQQQNERLVESE